MPISDLDFKPTEDAYEIAVIGGGPAGATAALYAARAGHRTVVIDKGLKSGALGRAGQIANYPGVHGPLSGADLVRSIRDQAASFGADFVNEKVLQVDLSADPKQIWAAERAYQARAIIIATGAMGRKELVPGEERLLGRGVSYCATCDGPFFRGQRVAVAGNNDEAVEEALTVARFADEVHLLSPTTGMQAAEDLVQELESNPRATLHLGVRVVALLGKERVEGVRIAAVRGEEEQTLDVDGVFFFLQGTQPITDFLGEQLSLKPDGCLLTGEFRETEIPGVFAAGDVVCKHLKQSVVAAAEGAQAAMAADRYLSGREKLRPDWRHS
jgi:thioredoxin reductase (NADPH)